MSELAALDSLRYQRAVALGALVPMLLLASTSALQSELFQVARDLAAYGEIYSVPLWARLVANNAVTILIVVAVRFLPVDPQRRGQWYSMLLAVAVGGVLVRGVLQLVLGVYLSSQLDLVVVDAVMGLICGLFSLAVGAVLAESFKKARAQERAASRQALRASAALDALQVEELRVRGEMAEALQGTVQRRLALIGDGLRGVCDELPVGGSVTKEHRRRLAEISSDVDELREHGLRELSQLLHPAGVNIGLSQAVRMMLQRVPSAIRVQAHIDESIVEYDGPAFARISQALRLLAVRLLEEAVSNALRHGNAGQIAVSLDMDPDRVLTIIVDDDGSGVPERAAHSGLHRLRDRLTAVGGTLDLGHGPLSGARLSATIPLGTA